MVKCKVCDKELSFVEELNFNGYCARCEAMAYDVMVEASEEGLEWMGE